MTTFSTLAAMQLLAAEQNALEAISEDGQGMLSSVNNDIAEIKIKLNKIAATIPAGTNLTAINAAITALA